MNPNLFVLPLVNKNNLYLEILYKPLRDAYAVQLFSLLAIFGALVRGQKTIAHIHWEENIYGSRFAPVSIFRMSYRYPLLFLAKLLGARFVWTMHNAGSHDSLHPRIDALGRALMRRLAQGIIIQNAAAAKTMAARYPRKRVVYIPHPSYVGAYGPRQPEAGAALRARLGVGEGDTLLLSLGALRPYKRLEGLIEAVKLAHAAEPRLRLMIAGKGDPAYIDALKTLAGGSPAVMLLPEFVPDAQIPAYLAAADYAAFAHGESSLTSGAVVLALSYGLPVVALAMPAGELIQEGINGFAPQSQAEMVELFKKLPSMPRPDPQKVMASLDGAAPNLVAQEMQKLYTQLL